MVQFVDDMYIMIIMFCIMLYIMTSVSWKTDIVHYKKLVCHLYQLLQSKSNNKY